MKEKSILSKLKDHKFKKGLIIPPFMDGLNLSFQSWSHDRLPEFIWMGLILDHYGRNEGIKRANNILITISKYFKDISFPRLSVLLNLSNPKQEKVYDIILEQVEKSVLSPLTILYRMKDHPIFYKKFFNSVYHFEDRLEKLVNVLKKYYSHQDEDTTDLRYLAINLMFINKKLKFNKNTLTSIKAFEEYASKEHSDEEMKFYRPSIRALEGMSFFKNDQQFILKFWRDLKMITQCKPMIIEKDKGKNNYDAFIPGYQKLIEYIYCSYKENIISSDKYDVILGSFTYILKIIQEIVDGKIGKKIIGRLGLRTITEVLVMVKYLQKKEKDNKNIWKDYKAYGLSKYKYVLLKNRENSEKSPEYVEIPLIEVLVNETKWEEFQNIDLRYFDKESIKSKFEEAEESNLFDLSYEYGTSFVHGFWGAIRESALLQCNNVAHNFHSVPDLQNQQKIADVTKDCIDILLSSIEILKENFEIPSTYLHFTKIQ